MKPSVKSYSKILVAGHTGLLGSSLLDRLCTAGKFDVKGFSSSEVDFLDQKATWACIKRTKPDFVFMCAGRVGGIEANRKNPADFIYENLMMECNIMKACLNAGVGGFMFFGSTCMYPGNCFQPMKEEMLMTGPMEETSSAYATAKIAGMEMVKAFRRQHGLNAICAILTGLYGPHDEFDPAKGHFLGSLISRFHKAKLESAPAVALWGTGKPIRDLLYVDDAADAAIFLMEKYNDEKPINIGPGSGRDIHTIAQYVAKEIGYSGEILFDATNPDGAPSKILDTKRINELGWCPHVGLEEGLHSTVEWYRANIAKPARGE